jgi:threonyl-tRNA synthetase
LRYSFCVAILRFTLSRLLFFLDTTIGYIVPEYTLSDNTVIHAEAAKTPAIILQENKIKYHDQIVAAVFNGDLIDLHKPLTASGDLNWVKAADSAGLEVIRHSTAHLLAHAVKQLFPSAQVTIGPVIEHGFYYDFYYPEGFSEHDLSEIEARMQALSERKLPIVRRVVSKADSIALFKKQGEHYKTKIIERILDSEELTLYEQADFIDLCRGPHVPHTGFLKAFKLMRVSGAYWEGDAKNEMLQRIYGTAWADRKALKTYLFQLEEAKKRDHRLLGKKMGWFFQSDDAPGMAFWMPDGWQLYQNLKYVMRCIYKQGGYQEISTPQLLSTRLWETSGHLEKFSNEMFMTETEHHTYAVKPMSCPCHILMYQHELHSYRDLPIRLAEFGSCHRCEPSGTLHGLMRVRHLVQDDGHIFCTEKQVSDEVATFITQLKTVYRAFGFNDLLIYLSTRPEKRIGSDAIWDEAEHALTDALNAQETPWTLMAGEGAFYGPKIEFSLKDCLGRIWQCGTMQLDFSLPKRFDLNYIAEDGTRKTPVMLHRAIYGSLERFIAILIEHHAGILPLWIAPKHIVVLAISEQHSDYVAAVVSELQDAGIKAFSDARNEKINFMIREYAIKRIPYVAICGDQEVADKTISIRDQQGKRLGVFTIPAWIDYLKKSLECPFSSNL